MPPTNHTQYATRSLLKEGAGSTGGNRSSAPGGGRASQPVRSVKQTMLLRMPAAPSVFAHSSAGNPSPREFSPLIFAAPQQTRCDDAMAPVKKPSHAGKAVVAGGISGAVEICCTYPVSRLDLCPRNPCRQRHRPSAKKTFHTANTSLHRLSSPRQCCSCRPRSRPPWRSYKTPCARVASLASTRWRRCKPNPDTNSNRDANAENGALPGGGPVL